MSRLPYVGVSGFVSRAEVEGALAAFERAFPTGDRLLMVGVLASSKTLDGQTNKYQRRYPRVRAIADIFVEHPRALNLVHYAAEEHRFDDLARLLELALGEPGDDEKTLVHGFQFNGAWPSPETIERLVSFWPRDGVPRLVLQCRPWAPDGGPARLARSLRPYWPLVTDVLLDASGGRGEPLSIELVDQAVAELQGADLGVGIGIAGGLCAEALPGVSSLLRAHPGLSIDAEGRLRDDAGGGGNLVLEKVEAYLAAASRAFGGAP